MTNSPTKPVAPLSDEALAEIERGARLDQCLKVVSEAVPNCFCRRPAGHVGYHSESVPPTDVFWIHPAIPALCQTVRALKQQLHAKATLVISDVTQENAALREQLAQALQERDEARRTSMRICTHPNTYPLKETTRRCHDCGLEFLYNNHEH